MNSITSGPSQSVPKLIGAITRTPHRSFSRRATLSAALFRSCSEAWPTCRRSRRFGRLDVARRAVEQAHAEVALQVADAFADHGLGQAHAFGGGADAAQLDHVEEGLYVFKAQAHGESRNNREADCRMRENSW